MLQYSGCTSVTCLLEAGVEGGIAEKDVVAFHFVTAEPVETVDAFGGDVVAAFVFYDLEGAVDGRQRDAGVHERRGWGGDGV